MNPTSPQQLNTQLLFKPPTAVIYSKDFEPISVIPMNNDMYGYFTQYEVVRFPIQAPISIEDMSQPPTAPENMYAEISAMRVYSNDGLRLLLIARNDETALLMRNTFLPGQTKELNFIKTQAFYQGMVKAIKQIRNKDK
jgi:hypothetical protein